MDTTEIQQLIHALSAEVSSLSQQVQALKTKLGETERVLFFHRHLGTDFTNKIDAGSATSPGGSDSYIQFNDSSAFGGVAGFTFDKTTVTLALSSGVGRSIIKGGTDILDIRGVTAAGGSDGFGAAIELNGGYGDGIGVGGSISLTGGSSGGGAAFSDGGDINIQGGAGFAGVGGGRDGSIILTGTSTSTTRTGNFVYIPTSGGAPTGVPPTISGVAMVYNTSSNKLYIYNGAWKSVTLT